MNRAKHSREFKHQAVKLYLSGEKTAATIAEELGISRSLLYKWKSDFQADGEKAFTRSQGRPRKPTEDEVEKLKDENARLKEELEIIKKAAAYFARDLK